jgi:serine/threonine protein kinase
VDGLGNSFKQLSLDNFVIIRELGKGSFGRVVMAVEKASKLVFAIKIMSKY